MKESNVTGTETKKWKVQASDGVEVTFYPVFVTQDIPDGQVMTGQTKEVECKFVHMHMQGPDGSKVEMDIGFQELFMFIYYCASEEKRQELQLRQMKHISQIPYEVTFKLDSNEIEAKMAKRLIQLPVDEITMAIARSEAQLLAGKATLGSLEQWFRNKRLAKKGRKS